MSQSSSRTKVVISEPIKVTDPLLGMRVFPPFELSLPWEILPKNRLRRSLIWQLVIFVAIGGLFALPLTLSLRKLFQSSISWQSAPTAILAIALIVGLVILLDMIVEIRNTLLVLGDATQPIVVFDEIGFLDRRISERKVPWDHVQSVRIVFGRRGILGSEVVLREDTPYPARGSVGLRFDRIGIPSRKTRSFVVETQSLQESDQTAALALYMLWKRFGQKEQIGRS